MAARFDPEHLSAAFSRVRDLSLALAEPLEPEDQCIQSMPDVSPTKWHLAHTSWFFETFVLAGPDFAPYRSGWDFLFNSYYQTVGEMHARPQRGLLSRPTVSEIQSYRRWVDERVLELLARGASDAQLRLVELGLHHEQQHQELLLTDILHVLSANPLAPSYRREPRAPSPSEAQALRWIEDPGGLVEVGRDLDAPAAGFGFDNEGPRHKRWLEPFAVASRPATCGEYLAFMADGGYRRPQLWLAEGWDTVCAERWTAPAYWRAADPSDTDPSDTDPGSWSIFTLDGQRPLGLDEPVTHLSYYEADAFARWSEARLPSEAEWERVVDGVVRARAGTDLRATANLLPLTGEGLASAALHPEAASLREADDETSGLAQVFGEVWEWTASPYAPFPGYRAPPGAVGEYNGKFMCNQMVLRGGSCVTPADHVRVGYRNFFHAPKRWQFTGVRLARDLS
ncbi:hypothetical protein PPSIR1_19324 [Plesiocystis pacifica SIR-1]|uniref:Sulfatase-modifying factor enzyme domain-containing protein n=1 Tax=Plesiocystis pacifica SIR-1 TaxID=391625 RepID=A6G830_9BACT|nr:hypothetical protein PPSIR1_19324 [Plesiocystis pacifica SIR-1]